MIRTLNVAERNLFAKPPNVITVAAATATILLPDERYSQGEIAFRYIQNVANSDLYYSFGVVDSNNGPVCDNATQYNGVLKPWAQLDCSNHRLIVCGYSAGGTTVSTTTLIRKDVDVGNNNISGQ